jgi:hypothetical protein
MRQEITPRALQRIQSLLYVPCIAWLGRFGYWLETHWPRQVHEAFPWSWRCYLNPIFLCPCVKRRTSTPAGDMHAYHFASFMVCEMGERENDFPWFLTRDYAEMSSAIEEEDIG